MQHGCRVLNSDPAAAPPVPSIALSLSPPLPRPEAAPPPCDCGSKAGKKKGQRARWVDSQGPSGARHAASGAPRPQEEGRVSQKASDVCVYRPLTGRAAPSVAEGQSEIALRAPYLARPVHKTCTGTAASLTYLLNEAPAC